MKIPAKPKKIVLSGKSKAPAFEEEQPTRKDSPSVVPLISTATAAPVVPLIAKPTNSQLIWKAIQTRPIQMFGLPNQFVGNHVTPMDIDPEILYVKVKSTAVVPQLEVALMPEFDMIVGERYIEIFPVKGTKRLSLSFQGL